MRTSGQQGFRFETYFLDTADECLRCGEETTTLTPRAYAVLRLLLERRGRLVTKEDLLDTVWRGVIVGDAVLKVCVGEIRKALGDDAKDPRFIETLHRRGYRFIAAAEPVGFGPTELRTSISQQRGTFVGRDNALAKLETARARSHNGERAFVFVIGEAGIGKTATVETFLARSAADADRIVLLRGQCIEAYGAGEAYLPLLEAMGRLCRSDHRDLGIATLRRFAPTWLLQLSGVIDPDESQELRRETFGATPERMIREWTESLEQLSHEVPVVVVLEDLQWSDVSTLDALSYLARREEPARILVIGTLRATEAADGNPPLHSLRADLSARGFAETVALEALSPDEIGAYLRERFAGVAPPAGLAERLHARTRGNAFFLVHVVDDLSAQASRDAGDDGAEPRLAISADDIEACVPASVQELIETELGRLHAEDREILETTGVVGPECSAHAIAAAMAREPGEIEARCEQIVHRTGILQSTGVSHFPDGSIWGRYGLAHALYASVILQRVSESKRARLHARVGIQAERVFGDRVSEVAPELAHHFETAHDIPRAVRYLRLAAEVETRRHAHREAGAYLRHALSLAEQSTSPDRVSMQADLLEQLALVYRSAGDMLGAAEQLEKLVALSSREGFVNREVRALLYLVSALFWVRRHECLPTIDRASERAESLEDELLRAHAHGYCAHWNLNLRGYRSADAEVCAHAVDAARRANDRPLLCLHLTRQIYAHVLSGRYDFAIRDGAESARLASDVGDAFDFLLGQFFTSWALIHAGRWGAALACIDRGRDLAARNAHRLWADMYEVMQAQLYVEAGDCDTAADLCRSGYAIGSEDDQATGQLYFHSAIVLSQAEIGRGNIAVAEEVLGGVAERLNGGSLMDWVLYFPYRYVRALAAFAVDAPERAQSEAEALLDQARTSREPTYEALGHALLARAIDSGARRSKQSSDAESTLRQAIEIAESTSPALRLKVLEAAGPAILAADAEKTRERAALARAELVESLDTSNPRSVTLREALLARALPPSDRADA